MEYKMGKIINEKNLIQFIFIIVGGLFALIAAIVGGFFLQDSLKYMDISIQVTYSDDAKKSARISIEGNQEKIEKTTDDNGELLIKNVLKSKYKITTSSDGYIDDVKEFDQHDAKLLIKLKLLDKEDDINFSFKGWKTWNNEISVTLESDNTIIISGKVNDTAGYQTNGLNRNLSGKTLLLDIKNSSSSLYSNNRMLKVTVNQDNSVLEPSNITNLISNEYIPNSDKQIKFTLPQNLDGKMEFVFYMVNLKKLKITASIQK
jgi:hypothetical protein